MQRDAFIHWLTAHRGQKANSAASRAGNCATVERAYARSLDTFDPAEFTALLEEFRYSTDDQRAGRPVLHRVCVDGDQRTGTATLRSALSLYRAFRFGDGAGPPQGPAPAPALAPVGAGGPAISAAGEWPQWESPSEEDSLLLARVLARHARFLKPEIVQHLVDDNRRHASDWRAALTARGVPADAYLWDGSPCAFPGVRRYSGSSEIAEFRKRKPSDGKLPPDALALDDNDYPKQLWSFVFRGKLFQKQGPAGYNLAHLADHKDHNNRAAADFVLAPGTSVEGRLHGLYTCPTNTVYLPTGLLKPTDFHPSVRGLFIRKAQALYGACCRIVPPFLGVPECGDSRWDIEAFEWADPVGGVANLPAFFEFRSMRMNKLFEAAPATGP